MRNTNETENHSTPSLGVAHSDTAASRLHLDDLDCLRRSGLSDPTLEKMGVVSLTAEEIRDRLGVTVKSGGYLIPYQEVTDQTGQQYCRVRLRRAADGQRYCGGRGDDAQVYVPAGFDDLPLTDLLVITEGEKKAMKAVQEGIACVAVQGTWSWADPADRAVEKHHGCPVSSDTRPLQKLLELARSYKQVLIQGDSDLLSKPEAAAGFEALARSLRAENIAAYLAFCPPGKADPGQEADSHSNLAKQGLDDWLIAEGPMLVARTLVLLHRAAQIFYEQVTEAHLAKQFALQNRLRLAHSPGQGWVIWTGVHWQLDNDQKFRTKFVDAFASTLRTQAEDLRAVQNRIGGKWAHIKDADLPRALSSWLLPLGVASKALVKAHEALGKLHGIKAILELAQPHLHVPDEQWDHDPLLLGVRNGIVDLRTGALRAPDPAAYIMRCAGTEFDPTAQCPVWLQFLQRVQPGDEDRHALQVLAGYSCTGLTGEQAAYFHYGVGANGKSTFFKALTSALGSYAVTAGPALVDRKSDHREQAYETARLVGSRLVTIGETENGMDLAMAVVKRLTGGEDVSARVMYGKPFTFDPVCKLHLSTNHLPHVRDTTHGAWRRIRTISWSETITKNEQDDRLMQKLKAEIPGILTWMVKGAQLYLQGGLAETTSSTALASEMRETCNNVKQWSQAELSPGPDVIASSSLMYKAYTTWAAHNGVTPQTSTSWGEELKSQGYEKCKNSKGNMVWKGVSLASPEVGLQHVADPPYKVQSEFHDLGLKVLPGGGRTI